MSDASTGQAPSSAAPSEGANPAAADRRLYRRYAIAIPAEMAIGDQKHVCAITDLSLGGVAVQPAFPDSKGEICRLHCEDFYFDEGMQGRVVNVNQTATHIEFQLDEDMEAALTMFLVMSPATR